MQVGKLNPLGKLNFPGFQEILDFTSAGSESSVSVAVDGDTDKEYRIVSYNPDSSDTISIFLNSDTSASNYGYQYLYNNNGTIQAARSTLAGLFLIAAKAVNEATLLTPSGFIKTFFCGRGEWTSGTTMYGALLAGSSWNSTASVTSITFTIASGNFTAGTRITVWARRSQ